MDKLPTKTNNGEDSKVTGLLDQHGQPIHKSEDKQQKDKTKEELEKDAKAKAKKALEDSLKKAVIVDVEELAEAESKKAADAYMTESQKSMKGVSGFFKKIWKHTYFDEFYRQRQVGRAAKDIKESGNIYAGRKDANKNTPDIVAHEGAMKAITDRFSSEYDEMLSKGEEKWEHQDDNAKTNLKKIISDFAEGKIDEDNFVLAKDKIIRETSQDKHMHADNFLEIAQKARVAVDHGVKMEELDLDFNFMVGKAKSSLKTEAHFNKVDQVVDKMKKSKIGRFISPAVLATATGIAYCVAINVSKKLASSKAAAMVTLGGAAVVTGAFAGLNEAQRVTREREQHGLEMAEGGVVDKGDKRREQLEKYQYQMESSNDLAENLRSLMFEKNEDGIDVPKENIAEEDVKAIMASLSDIYARRSLNEEKRADLISYSNFENIEKERTELDILAAKAKVDLRNRIAGGLKAGIPEGKDFDTYLKEQIDASKGALLGGEKGMDKLDKQFSGYKTKRAFKKAIVAVGMGLVIGGGIQEVKALFSEHSEGIVEGIMGHHNPGAMTQTPLEHLRGWISGNPTHITGNAYEHVGNHNFSLPEGTKIIENPDHTFNIIRGDNTISDHVPLTYNADGSLDHHSLELLGKDGIVGNTTHTIVDGTKTVSTSAHDYVNGHHDNMMHVKREWMGNDTPMHGRDPETGKWILERDPITGKMGSGADLNELNTQWAGEHGTGIASNGHYQMNVSHMTNEGSFQNGVHVNAQDVIKSGHAVALLSVTHDTQAYVIPVPITADGMIDVDPNSEAGKMLFENVNGHAVYTGAFLEVANPNGTTADGHSVMQILGTHEGTDHAHAMTETIKTHSDVAMNHLGVPLKPEMPYFVPILSRKPLGKLGEKEKEVDENGKPVSPAAGETPTEEKIDSGDTMPIAVAEKKNNKKISQEESSAMADDMKMLNSKRQEQAGIITITDGDFKSEYGKQRYNDLKNIAEGKPVTFNHEELLKIGDEIENVLVNSTVVKPLTEEEISKRAYEIYEKRQKNGEQGNEKSDWEKARKELEDERNKGEEKENVSSDEVEKIKAAKKAEDAAKIKELEDKLKEPENTAPTTDENPAAVNKAADAGRVDTGSEAVSSRYEMSDLFKLGTVFEDNSNTYKTSKKSAWWKSGVEVEVTNKETGGKTNITWNKKNLKEQFIQRQVKIKNVIN